MNTYSEMTEQIGDQWVAAIKRAEQAVSLASGRIAQTSSRAMADLPQLPVPDMVAQAAEAISSRIPDPCEIVAANFALAERLLGSQRDLAMRLLEAARPAAETAKAAKAPEPTPAKRTAGSKAGA